MCALGKCLLAQLNVVLALPASTCKVVLRVLKYRLSIVLSKGEQRGGYRLSAAYNTSDINTSKLAVALLCTITAISKLGE